MPNGGLNGTVYDGMNGRQRICGALLAVFGVAAAVFVGCSGESSRDREELLVFAAMSLTDAFDEAVALYERENDVDVQISYAASQALAQQIASGAPASVFVSAGAPPVQFLRERGLVEAESQLLTNKLVVVTNRSLEERSPVALTSSRIERVAIAAPDIAPAGAYGREALKAAGLWESLQEKIVTAPDVRAAMAFVESGNASVGIVYATDAVIAKGLETVDIFPHDSYGPIVYPVVTVTSDERKDATDAFVQFLTGAAAGEIFRSHGFEPIR